MLWVKLPAEAGAPPRTDSKATERVIITIQL